MHIGPWVQESSDWEWMDCLHEWMKYIVLELFLNFSWINYTTFATQLNQQNNFAFNFIFVVYHMYMPFTVQTSTTPTRFPRWYLLFLENVKETPPSLLCQQDHFVDLSSKTCTLGLPLQQDFENMKRLKIPLMCCITSQEAELYKGLFNRTCSCSNTDKYHFEK